MENLDKQIKDFVNTLVEQAEEIAESNKDDKEYAYVTDYMSKYMYPKVDYVRDTEYKYTEEIQAELEYRKFVLEMDIESNVIDNVLTGVADAISIFYEEAKRQRGVK